jgi:hypothetical protein
MTQFSQAIERTAGKTRRPVNPFFSSLLDSSGARGTVYIAGNVVTVTVTITQRMQILDVAGLSAITVHASTSAVPDRGILGVSGGFANSEGSGGMNPRVVSPGGRV